MTSYSIQKMSVTYSLVVAKVTGSAAGDGVQTQFLRSAILVSAGRHNAN